MLSEKLKRNKQHTKLDPVLMDSVRSYCKTNKVIMSGFIELAITHELERVNQSKL